MNKLAVLINNRDRPTELALLLQSLRTQSFKAFDIYILDDCSGTLLNNYHFLNMIITRINQEGNRVHINRTEFPHGVSKARQRIVDIALEKPYKYLLRVDDDCILEPDYIERLFKVIEAGYDLATGVTVPFPPMFVRDPKNLNGTINRIIIDKDGNFLLNSDDCGMNYTDSLILPAHHFRSCALYKSEIHKKVNYIPTKLSLNGYREEEIFSLKLLLNGYKIGCDTKAINYHLITPSGGERPTMNMAPFNQQMLCEFVKENKDELIKLFPSEIDSLELMKENNLLR